MTEERLLLEFDLAGAEWIVVAYLCQDEAMLRVAQGTRSPHVETAHLMTGLDRQQIEDEDKFLKEISAPEDIKEVREQQFPEVLEAPICPRTMSVRQMAKKANHALNYGMGYGRFALEAEVPQAEAKTVVEAYRDRAYPGLVEWQEAEKRAVRMQETLVSPLDRRVKFQDRVGQETFNKAFSFKPQSTVFDITADAMHSWLSSTKAQDLKAHIHAQVHDSLIFSYPPSPIAPLATFCQGICFHHMRPTLTIHGRRFSLAVTLKVGWDWGHMVPVDVDRALPKTARSLKKALKELGSGAAAT